MITTTSRKLGLVPIFAVISLFLGVGTAFAVPNGNVNGSGAGVGWEFAGPKNGTPFQPVTCPNAPPELPFFGTVPSDDFEFVYTGSAWTGVPAGGGTSALYNGDSKIEVSVGQHVISPVGTHTTCADIAGPPTPAPVTAAKITGNAPGPVLGNPGKVDCKTVSANGTFLRVGSAVTFSFAVDCDEVKWNVPPLTGSVAEDPVTVQITGTMVPCNDPFTGTPNPECSPPLNTPPPSWNGGSILHTAFSAD